MAALSELIWLSVFEMSVLHKVILKNEQSCCPNLFNIVKLTSKVILILSCVCPWTGEDWKLAVYSEDSYWAQCKEQRFRVLARRRLVSHMLIDLCKKINKRMMPSENVLNNIVRGISRVVLMFTIILNEKLSYFHTIWKLKWLLPTVKHLLLYSCAESRFF